VILNIDVTELKAWEQKSKHNHFWLKYDPETERYSCVVKVSLLHLQTHTFDSRTFEYPTFKESIEQAVAWAESSYKMQERRKA
jgi:hypothetical protein